MIGGLCPSSACSPVLSFGDNSRELPRVVRVTFVVRRRLSSRDRSADRVGSEPRVAVSESSRRGTFRSSYLGSLTTTGNCARKVDRGGCRSWLDQIGSHRVRIQRAARFFSPAAEQLKNIVLLWSSGFLPRTTDP